MTTTKFRDANGPHDDAIREEILHTREQTRIVAKSLTAVRS